MPNKLAPDGQQSMVKKLFTKMQRQVMSFKAAPLTQGSLISIPIKVSKLIGCTPLSRSRWQPLLQGEAYLYFLQTFKIHKNVYHTAGTVPPKRGGYLIENLKIRPKDCPVVVFGVNFQIFIPL